MLIHNQRDGEAFCTNQELRDEFDSNFTYRDISEGDILSLVLLLNREYKAANRSGELDTVQHLSRKIDYKKNKDGSLLEAYLYVNGDYFTRRECISFNRDGYIGFAGWASDRNLNPIRRAFWFWLETLRFERTSD